jgi:hypothetical protein
LISAGTIPRALVCTANRFGVGAAAAAVIDPPLARAPEVLEAAVGVRPQLRSDVGRLPRLPLAALVLKAIVDVEALVEDLVEALSQVFLERLAELGRAEVEAGQPIGRFALDRALPAFKMIHRGQSPCGPSSAASGTVA